VALWQRKGTETPLKRANNLFGFGSKTTVHKQRGQSRRDVARIAESAGRKSGDTHQFKAWSVRYKSWGPEALKEFERAYRKGVETGESVAERKRVEKRGKEVSSEVAEDVVNALAGLGMSVREAKQQVKRHERAGDSFDTLFKKVMQRNPITIRPTKINVNPSLLGTRHGRESEYRQSKIYQAGHLLGIKDRRSKHAHRGDRWLIDEADRRFPDVAPAYRIAFRQGYNFGFEKTSSNPKGGKFDRCVTKVSKSCTASPYAVCQKTVGRGNPVHIATLKAGSAEAQVKQVGAHKFTVDIKKGTYSTHQDFDGLPVAMAWARLRLHEVMFRPNPKTGRANPIGAAERVYEEFHGFPSKEVLEYTSQEYFHSVTVGVGQLVCIDVVLPENGKSVPLIAKGFRFDPEKFLPLKVRYSKEAEAADASWIFEPKTSLADVVQVTCSEDRRQLFFHGGDQSLPTERIGLTKADEHDHMLIGTIVNLTYRTRKSFEGKDEKDFHHEFGKEGSRGICPVLLYFPRSKSMKVAGGRYYIAPPRRDIGASPGITG